MKVQEGGRYIPVEKHRLFFNGDMQGSLHTCMIMRNSKTFFLRHKQILNKMMNAPRWARKEVFRDRKHETKMKQGRIILKTAMATFVQLFFFAQGAIEN